jgi:YD repeat-containing protein
MKAPPPPASDRGASCNNSTSAAYLCADNASPLQAPHPGAHHDGGLTSKGLLLVMPLSRSISRPLFSSLSLLLSYTLFITLCTPFIFRRAEAASASRPAAHSTAQVETASQNSNERSNGLLVRFRPGTPGQEIDSLIEANGLRRVRRLRGQSGLVLLDILNNRNAEDAAADLRLNPMVESAEANYLITGDDFALKDQPFATQQLFNNRNNGLLSPPTRASNSLAITQGAPATVIAIIDSGIDWTHTDLSGKEWINNHEQINSLDDDQDGFVDNRSGWDFVAESSNEIDEQGHGTAVAGLILSQGNNAASSSGVAWQPSLMSLRVLDGAGTGDVAHAVEAIDYSVAHGAQVINCSWGTNGASQALKLAIERGAARGVVVVTSSGNAGRDIESAPRYPASFDLSNIIAVASVDNADQLASWSDWGATHVSVAAPGVEISSTKSGGGYQAISGTSVSAAVVSGVAGLIKSLRPRLSAERTRELIIGGAREVAALQGKVASAGVINPQGAVGMVNTLPPGEGVGDNDGGSESGGNNNGSAGDAGTGVPGQWDNGDRFRVAPPEPRRGAPGPNLPNLDEMRRLRTTPPRAREPIPSKRCSPHLRDCSDRKRPVVESSSEINPTISPEEPQQQASLASSPTTLLAYNGSFPALEPLLGLNTGAVSDSPFSIRWPVSLLAPALQSGGGSTTGSINVALATNGGTASASSTTSVYPSSNAIDGSRRATNGTSWADSTAYLFDDWLQIDFKETKTINEIDVITQQDDAANPVEPTLTQTFSLYGITSFDVQYWNGTDWANVPGGRVLGNNKVWRQFTFAPLTTSRIKVVVHGSADGAYSRIVEVEAYEASSTSMSDSTQNLGAEFATARLDPVNRTGGGGEDLLSGNYNWSLPLVSLPGRAGLDLGLSLSYNSLVWTRSGTSIAYDADHGFPSPGFRLGFPVIQQQFYNAQTAGYAYLLITPSGAHVELRQVGSTNIYEAADSSYLQLDADQMILRSTDGTRLSYALISGEYRCTEVKDRNGNFMTVSYDGAGYITTITDTLGRNIDFEYYIDANGVNTHNLIKIKQVWNGDTAHPHELATFSYLQPDLTIQTNFIDEQSHPLTINGAVQNGTIIPVLEQVGLPDGSFYKFTYTTWGQVTCIAYYGRDGHERRQVSYNLPQNASVTQMDCPRFTERRDWAENWNGDAEGGVAAGEEAVTSYNINFAGGMSYVTLPDGTIYKESFSTSGWQRGLTTGTEILSGISLKKWTTTAWTQDDTSLAYQKNPRMTETNIYDAEGNRRRTAIDYGPYAMYGLPYKVTEYKANGSEVLRETYTDYNLDAAYLNQRIIGLVSARYVKNGPDYLSKTSYAYDTGGAQLVATTAANGTVVNATQHDPSYNTGFTARGLVTYASRFDVTDINNPTKALTTQFAYDTDGSLLYTSDPLGHQTSVSYTDSFSDGITRNTFAYPTTVTDADGFSSLSKYHYDLGAVTYT